MQHRAAEIVRAHDKLGGGFRLRRYSRQDIDNTDAQAPTAFKTGQYMLGNILCTPVPSVMFGGEFQWGRRENFSDGFHSDGVKLQFSFKYNFSYKLGG